jgi:hypothetical protein
MPAPAGSRGHTKSRRSSSDLVRETYVPVLEVIQTFMDAGASDGSITRRVDPNDFLLIMGFLWRIEPGPEAEAHADRLLNFVFGGLNSQKGNRRTSKHSLGRNWSGGSCEVARFGLFCAD